MPLSFFSHRHVCDEHKCKLDGLDEFAIDDLVDLLFRDEDSLAARAGFFLGLLGHVAHKELEDASSCVQLNGLQHERFVLGQVGQQLQCKVVFDRCRCLLIQNQAQQPLHDVCRSKP